MRKVRFLSTIPALTAIIKPAVSLVDHQKGLNEFIPPVLMKFKLGVPTVKDESVLPYIAKGLSTVAGGAAIIKSIFETASPEVIRLALDKIQENKMYGRSINFKIHPEDERLAYELTKHPSVKPAFEEAEIVEEAPEAVEEPEEHEVTKEDLEANPELAEEGLEEGDIVGVSNETVELTELTVAQLDEILKAHKIPGRSTVTKRDDKIKLIQTFFESQ